MEAMENNLDKYKSYIQKRRVGENKPVDYTVNGTSAFKAWKSDEDLAESYNESFPNFSSVKIPSDTKEENPADNVSSYLHGEGQYNKESSVTALHRTDPGLYQRLYGQKHKNTPLPHYSRYTNTYGTAGHGTEIEDNRTTVLAIKIIKQTLVCFALLGLIVLMQNRGDTGDTLAFIRQHVVETHIEPKSILTGLEDIVQECSRLLGGSP